jgi:hypothetical protein
MNDFLYKQMCRLTTFTPITNPNIAAIAIAPFAVVAAFVSKRATIPSRSNSVRATQYFRQEYPLQPLVVSGTTLDPTCFLAATPHRVPALVVTQSWSRHLPDSVVSIRFYILASARQSNPPTLLLVLPTRLLSTPA